jgi:SAM-dependent methyltransferase
MASWRDFAAALTALRLKLGARVLDVGCGSGAVTRLVAQRYRPSLVVGLDRNESLLVGARRLAEASGVAEVSFAAGDARALPFGDGRFDLVWAAFVVEYLAGALDGALRELARVTRPGGQVAIFDVAGFLLGHAPLDPDLAGRLARWREQAVGHGFDPEIGPKLPAARRAAGLIEVQARTFPDPELYPPGPASPAVLASWQRRLAGMGGLPSALGSAAAAEQFRRDYLALLQHPDHRADGANWLVWGRVPG